MRKPRIKKHFKHVRSIDARSSNENEMLQHEQKTKGNHMMMAEKGVKSLQIYPITERRSNTNIVVSSEVDIK